jgi:curved DNA-binding protein CbpA
MAYSIQQGLFKYEILDYHAILGVPLGANVQQVRQRYLAVAQRLHPDTCKAESERAKEQASQIFSKLVNPAYEKLAKARSRGDYLLVLSQMGKTLAVKSGKITLTGEPADKLNRETENIDLAYRKLLQSLTKKQYNDLDRILENIGQISELNLVYLQKTEGHGLQEKKQMPVKATATNPGKSTQGEEEVLPIVRYIRRARESLEREDLTRVLLELRDALNLEPNNVICHSLLGLTYLRQNQIAMAKVHINKAYQLNPRDPDAIKAKQALDKVVSETHSHKPGGILDKFFGGKKTK